MNGLPKSVLHVPLYIPLPSHPVTRKKRYMLINVELQALGNMQTRVRTQWTTVQPGITFQGSFGAPTIDTPSIQGVVVFAPHDALRSPIYMFVNSLEGKRIRPGLVVAVTIAGTPPLFQDLRVEATVDLNADIHTEYSREFTADGLGIVWGEGERSVTHRELDLAREEAVLEMKARGESVDVAGDRTPGAEEDEKRSTSSSEENERKTEVGGDIKVDRASRHDDTKCPGSCADHSVDDLYL